ncbi:MULTISPECIES: coniferyl aldehyde dehydrogenase [Paraburkholderia]|uniref:Aldehyde dehydrogenase n=1 Tax=Paraburkholderia metrosideri TaxID=580937 RepID=A0ABW9E291_9BURK
MSNTTLPYAPSAGQLRTHLAAMKRAQHEAGSPSAELRKDRIARAIDLLSAHRVALIDAISTDFGNRSTQQTLLADILASLSSLRFSREQVDLWTAAQPEQQPFPGARAWVEYQPLGVVGVVSPWNFPLVLAFGPLASVFAAGNRAMLKPSEHTPQTSALLAGLTARYFDADELTTVLGGPDIGAIFSALPFDHLIFTGSTQVAHHVMRAASDHLVPVTLELGGKSPVVVTSDADLARVAARVLAAKTFNAGQICLSPDYMLIDEARVDAFTAHAKAAVARMYPTLRDNPDYTSMVNAQGFERQHALIDDARRHGATVVGLSAAEEDLSDATIRKVAPTLIVGATDAMRVMQEEVFGPVLPVMTCRTLDDAIDYVNGKPRPLAVYFFGDDLQARARISSRTTSGALVVNDAMTHFLVDSLPFGGVGASGMGHYHGEYGFRALSHAKPVLLQSEGGESNLLMHAPYSEMTLAMIDAMIDG